MDLLRSIKDVISNKVSNISQVEMLYWRSKYFLASVLGKIWSEEHYAKWFYHLYTGKQLDLDNPKKFDEKVWWLKLNNRDPNLTRCSDKNAVRRYVEECGYGEILINQLDVFDSVDKLDLRKYKIEVVAKCTHNSGGLIFYDPGRPLSNKEIRRKKKRLAFILRQDASVLSREWNYKNVPHKIVVEEVIRDKNGNLPLDYKFMCFDGVPKLLFLDLGLINEDNTYNHNYPRNIYDMNFNLLPVWETRKNADYEVKKPKNFEAMVEIARKLSNPFPFCRVDLYNIDGQVYFGEITFYHGGGCNNIMPEEWDYLMGSWIDIRSPKIIQK